MEGITVRTATPADEAALLGLAADALGPQVAAVGGTFETGRAARTLRADTVFVAELEGVVAGFVAVCERGGALVVEQIAVATGAERRHVGNALLDWAEGYGTSRGLDRVRIAVEDDNRPAQDFYGRRGYLSIEAGVVERELTHAPT